MYKTFGSKVFASKIFAASHRSSSSTAHAGAGRCLRTSRSYVLLSSALLIFRLEALTGQGEKCSGGSPPAANPQTRKDSLARFAICSRLVLYGPDGTPPRSSGMNLWYWAGSPKSRCLPHYDGPSGRWVAGKLYCGHGAKMAGRGMAARSALAIRGSQNAARRVSQPPG